MGKWPETGNGTEEEAGEGRNFEGGGREKKKLAFKAFFSLSSLFFLSPGEKKHEEDLLRILESSRGRRCCRRRLMQCSFATCRTTLLCTDLSRPRWH